MMLRLSRSLGRREGRAGLTQAGFTIVELLIYMVVAVIVITGVYQLLIGQNRLFSKQREIQDVRTSLRSAGAVLAWELRQLAPTGGDLYSISADSFAIRSVQGTGIVCGIHGTLSRYGLYSSSGEFNTTTGDSALIFRAGGTTSEGDDVWGITRVSGNWDPVGGGVTSCAWGSGVPDRVLELVDPDGKAKGKGSQIDDVAIGAPLRAFRRVQYGRFLEDGRWWLGRKVGAAASYEKLTGPLQADSGLVLVWYDSDGNTTTIPDSVRMADIILKGESLRASRWGPGGSPGVQEDTLTIRVAVRG